MPAVYFQYDAAQFTVSSGIIEVPRKDLWIAELLLESGLIPPDGTQVKITLYDQQWIGRKVSGDVYHGKATCRVVGGLGDLRKRLPPKDYKGIPLRIPVLDILGACGLTLEQDHPVLNRVLPTYARLGGAASMRLSGLLGAYGAYWRVTNKGGIGVYLSSEVTTKATYRKDFDFTEMDYDPVVRRYTLAPNIKLVTHEDSFVAVNHEIISHTFDNSKIRSLVWL